MSGDGVRARTRAKLAAALARVVAIRGRLQLIEAMIPPGKFSPTLTSCVAAAQRMSA